MRAESRPGSLTGMPDDRLATVAVAVVVSDLQWTPDVSPEVMDRISRDAVAYPEQFDRRPVAVNPAPVVSERSAKRTVGRVAVIAMIVLVVGALVAFMATTRAAAAELAGLRIDLIEVASGYDQPILLTHAGDDTGTRYVVEQSGRIWPLSEVGREGTLFLDLSDDIATGQERGLLGLAFHPGFADNGRLFVNYTRREDGATVVSEFNVADGIADRASERQLLVLEQPFGNHNGGNLAFDASGRLLIGMGDGGSGGDPRGFAQDPESLLGKLLRIDVDSTEQPYGIPPDNGFAASDGYRPEIHAVGLRNPWRFSVDSRGGHIYVGDVGQGAYEEISVLPDGRGGQSFGWNEVEGPNCFRDGCDLDAHTRPALSYGRDEGCTVIGGYAYRGSQQPALDGVYLFGDYCSGTIWGADASALLSGSARFVPVGAIDGTLVSFGVDESGELYAIDHGGRVFQVVTEDS